ncbi:hypothetical protein GCM10020369_57460 [Cryptosporangium minutisporangium]|uniref:Uncharacterized protein n=1 Tax=Cryptosporangium minutisporangium TaxID=113569 RepID=A0ABP6T4U0_9ACTN
MSRVLATHRFRQSTGRRLVQYPVKPELSPNFEMNHEPTWSFEMLLLNETLARSRMQQAVPRRTHLGARRPARVVAAAAARLRDRL